jgi:hypothetical protein
VTGTITERANMQVATGERGSIDSGHRELLDWIEQWISR